MGWGRKPSCICGVCLKCKRREYMRAYYQSKSPEERHRIFIAGRDPERIRRQDRERHARMRNDPLYMKRRRAVAMVNDRISRGIITREPCEVCGDANANAHHDDYDKPLDVRWLCPQHHADVHREAA